MRKVLCVYVLTLIAGCAVGTQETTDIEPTSYEMKNNAVHRNDPTVPDFTDPKCIQVQPKPPGIPDVCGDFIAHDHPPYPVLIQYSIQCKALNDNDNCTVWAINPYAYDIYTWAYCCIPGDAGTYK